MTAVQPASLLPPQVRLQFTAWCGISTFNHSAGFKVFPASHPLQQQQQQHSTHFFSALLILSSGGFLMM